MKKKETKKSLPSSKKTTQKGQSKKLKYEDPKLIRHGNLRMLSMAS